MKKITHHFDGIERTLDFERFWYKVFAGEYVKEYPTSENDSPGLQQVNNLIMIIYCGIKADYEHRGEPCPVERKDVRRWVGEFTDEEAIAFSTKIAALNPKEETPGENPPQ